MYCVSNRKYKKIPPRLHDHDLLPDVSEIPSILRRRRAVSVGPQSEADAYETLAYREKRRRESNSRSPAVGDAAASIDRTASPNSKLEEYEHMMGSGSTRLPPSSDTDVNQSSSPQTSPESEVEESSPAELFARIAKPRVRYDVEVVTRLIVYSGEFCA